MAVGGVRAREAEEELGARCADRGALHTELGRAVLFFRERLWIDDMQVYVTARAGLQLFQELAYPRAVGLQLGDLVCGFFREEEVQVDGLLDALQDPVRAGRRGVQMVLGEIQPPAAQRVVEEDRESYEEEGERQQCAAAEC